MFVFVHAQGPRPPLGLFRRKIDLIDQPWTTARLVAIRAVITASCSGD